MPVVWTPTCDPSSSDPSNGCLGSTRPIQPCRLVRLVDLELLCVVLDLHSALEVVAVELGLERRSALALERDVPSSTVPRNQDSTLRPSHTYAAAWLPSTATAIAAGPSSVRPAYTTFAGNSLSSPVSLALAEALAGVVSVSSGVLLAAVVVGAADGPAVPVELLPGGPLNMLTVNMIAKASATAASVTSGLRCFGTSSAGRLCMRG